MLKIEGLSFRYARGECVLELGATPETIEFAQFAQHAFDARLTALDEALFQEPAIARRAAMRGRIPIQLLRIQSAVEAHRIEQPGSATVLTLGAHMCKWPIGDPSSDGFSFCGRRTGEEGPYCIEHARVAYQPAVKKGSRTGATDLARSLRRYI